MLSLYELWWHSMSVVMHRRLLLQSVELIQTEIHDIRTSDAVAEIFILREPANSPGKWGYIGFEFVFGICFTVTLYRAPNSVMKAVPQFRRNRICEEVQQIRGLCRYKC